MEVQYFHKKFPGKDPKPLMDHIQKVASGEVSFFPNVLSLVYDKLFEKSFPKDTPSNPSIPQVRTNQSATSSAPSQNLGFIFTPTTPSNPFSTTSSPTPGPSTIPTTMPPTHRVVVANSTRCIKKLPARR